MTSRQPTARGPGKQTDHLCHHARRELSVFVRFDSSVGRGDLVTEIGVGRVIRGTSIHTPLPHQASRGDWALG